MYSQMLIQHSDVALQFQMNLSNGHMGHAVITFEISLRCVSIGHNRFSPVYSQYINAHPDISTLRQNYYFANMAFENLFC